MFSTDATVHHHTGPSSRNPRRRQRTSNEEYTGTAAQHQNKRRKRTSIAPNTFDPPTLSKANGSTLSSGHELATKENGMRDRTPEAEPLLSKHQPLQQNGSIDKTGGLVLRSRSARSTRDRKTTRHDEGVLLARNDRYQVTKETNLPDEVQEIIRAKEPWQARFNEDLGHVVLFTHHKAVIWKYAQNRTTDSRITVIKFQNATPKAKEPLPFGALVHDPASGELALLVIRAEGKITYWESISSAANADILRQKQNGFHGLVGGLSLGEQVVDIAEAEADGFLLTTNSGRILYMSVRDSQGKPAILTESLRSQTTAGAGLFGNLKNVFNLSTRRNDIATVKRLSSKSKSGCKFLVVTKQAVIQIWDVARQSSKVMELQIDAKESLMRASRPADGVSSNFQVIDVALYPGRKRSEHSHHLLCLVGVQTEQAWSYQLIEANLHGNTFEVKTVNPLKFWNHPPEGETTCFASRSKLFIPEPGHTAIITFDKAMLVASLTATREGPDAQLQNEIEPQADAFQDVLYFARDRDFLLLGCCAVDASSQDDAASCMFFVNDFGLAHISASRFKGSESVETRRATQCKTKIDQVVFFGDLPNKLFDFHRAMQVSDWSAQEVQSAALEVNTSILNSSSSYIPNVAHSMDIQLKDRSAHLKALIKFVSRWNINAETRWELLWSAEKMVSARAVWQVYSNHLLKREEQKIPFRNRNTVLLWESLDAIHEAHKHQINHEKGENDIVRQFLVHDIQRLELLVVWSAKGIEVMADDGITNETQQAWLIMQACQVVTVALDTAFKFRENNAALYGFAPELFEDGIYKGSYKNLPEVWTSCAESCLTVPNLAGYTQDLASVFNNIESSGDSSDEEGNDLEETDKIKLVEDSVSMARLTCQVFDERYLFQEKYGDVDAFKETTYNQRRKLLVGLVDLMVPDEGLRLAEKYRDLPTLAEIICQSREIILQQLDKHIEEQEEILEQKLSDYAQKVSKYFSDYGMTWAQAFYSEKMARESVSSVLKTGGPSLSEYLAKNPSLVKAKWMYNVTSQQDYKGAVHDLLKCNADESNLWNKKVQLSLAKLSLLAAQETEQTSMETVVKQMRHADRRLTTIDIQDKLYAYTRPQLSSALDQYAEVELGMATFGKALKNTTHQRIVFKESLEKLITRHWIGEENLIDMLTLIYCPADLIDDDSFDPSRFFFALQTLRDSPKYEDTEQTSLIQKIIWRRAILQDDWAAINMTADKSEDELIQTVENTALFKTLIAGFHDGLLDTDLPPPQSISSLIDIGITSQDLASLPRWSSLDPATLQATVSDYSAENKKLTNLLEKARMDSWWTSLVNGARVELKRRMNSHAEHDARNFEEELAVEGRLNGSSEGANGHTYAHDTTAVDGEGDVVMD